MASPPSVGHSCNIQSAHHTQPRVALTRRDKELPLIGILLQGILCNGLEGLFHIAMADGVYHPNEDDFLENVSQIFGLSERQFRGLRARFVPDAEPDPFDVLGLKPDADAAQARAAWRVLVRENHPDQMLARGIPKEAVKLAKKRLIALKRAWEEIGNKVQ